MPDPRTEPFSVRAVGDTMAPGIRDGDTVTCEPAAEFIVGREYVVGLADGPIVLRVVRPGAPPGHVRLGLWNVDYADVLDDVLDDVPLADVLWLARVTTIVKADTCLSPA